jgi:hypothetical protein
MYVHPFRLNPYQDARGRFTSRGGANFVSIGGKISRSLSRDRSEGSGGISIEAIKAARQCEKKLLGTLLERAWRSMPEETSSLIRAGLRVRWCLLLRCLLTTIPTRLRASPCSIDGVRPRYCRIRLGRLHERCRGVRARAQSGAASVSTSSPLAQCSLQGCRARLPRCRAYRWRAGCRPTASAASVSLLPTAFIAAAMLEEVGWQGYAYTQLRASIPAGASTLLIGRVWALWHLAPLAALGRTASWISGWAVGTLALRILIVLFYEASCKSIVVAAAAHAASNLIPFCVLRRLGLSDEPRSTALALLTIAALAGAWHVAQSRAPSPALLAALWYRSARPLPATARGRAVRVRPLSHLRQVRDHARVCAAVTGAPRA